MLDSAQTCRLKDMQEADFINSDEPALLTPIWTTVSTLQALVSPTAVDADSLYFVLPHLTLAVGKDASTKDISSVLKDKEMLATSEAIVRAAAKAANSHSCSSILAGHSTESDEYGDIGIWFDPSIIPASGDVEDKRQTSRVVLSALGLDALLNAQGGQVRGLLLLKLQSTHFPCILMFFLQKSC